MGDRKKWIWILVLLSNCGPRRESLGLSEPVSTYIKWLLKIAILKDYCEDLNIVWEDMQKPPCLVTEHNKFLRSFFIILSLYLKSFFYWWQGVRVISHLSETARKGRKAAGVSAYSSNRNRNFVVGPKRVSSPRSLAHIRSLLKFCHCYMGSSEIIHSEDGTYSSLQKSKWGTSQWKFSVKRGGWIHLDVISYLKRFGAVRWKGTRLRHNSIRM